MRLSTASSDCKSQDKDHDLSATVHGRRNEIVVLDEQVRVVLADVELTDKGQDEEHGQRTVDSDEQVAHVPEDNGRVEVTPVLVAGHAVSNVQRNGHKESNEIGQSDPLITRAHAEHLARNAPSNGKSVELLYVLAGPDVCTLDGLQDLCLVLYDRVHHDPVEDASYKTASDLQNECDARWDMVLLCKSEVFRQKLRLRGCVVREASEVKVGEGAAREKVTCQHLADRLGVELEAGDAILSTQEQSEEECKAKSHEVSPPRQCRL